MKTKLNKPLVVLLVAAFCSTPAAAQFLPRGITEVSDNLYWAHEDSHRVAFLVTDEGVILADTISTEFSTWLKGEIESRFGVPVRYVLYSHHHWDHASGGAVFEETATFVGHENMLPNLARATEGEVRPPDQTFRDEMTVTLGGKEARLIHVGR
ncbi:MAG TPA: MBL fold metallo-hydrolase, partial [Gammaproteobacteria bacterium]